MAYWPSLPWSAVVTPNNKMTNRVDTGVIGAGAPVNANVLTNANALVNVNALVNDTNISKDRSPSSLLPVEPLGECQTVDLAIPWAIIGSESSCNICVNQPKVPAQAYIALSFNDWFEVWPISPGVYPNWDEDQNLIVGQSKIEFTQSHSGRMIQALEPAGVNDLHRLPGIDYSVRLLIESNGQSQEVVLDRRVSILGEKLPHSIRIKLGLSHCVYVVVLINQRCWLINTDQNSNGSSCERAHVVPLDGAAIKIGEVSFSAALNANKEADESEAMVGGNADFHFPSMTCTAAIGIESIESQVDAGNRLDLTFQNAGASQIEKKEPPPHELSSPNPERLTMEVTNRLIARSQAKWWRQKGAKIALTTSLLVGSAIATSWIVIGHVLPMIIEFQS